uniref:Ionotropic glutamate receptor C-terminal domain-containing protein n=1 Tax=Strigamia maritima TaxID=126957 RepID=T1JJ33_STRMM
FEIIQCKDGQVGALVNGRWTGRIGDLTRGVPDIAFGIVVTRLRRDVVTFSPQFHPFQYDIIYRKFDQQKWNFSFYFQPCTIEIWLCIFAASLTVILVKVLAENNLTRTTISSRYPVSNHFLNLINEFLLCWPIVLQGNLNSFTLKSMRVIFVIYTIFSMLLLISYNSKLTSLHATPTIKIPFASLDDMLQNTDFIPIISKGKKIKEMFMNNTAYANKKVLKVESDKKGIELTYSGKFAYLESLIRVKYLIHQNCSFAVAPNYISKESIALVYAKQFPYTDYFNSKILLLKQYGMLSHLFKRFIPIWESCANNPFNPTSLGQTIGLFILIMAGIFISLICGIIELIVNKFVD